MGVGLLLFAKYLRTLLFRGREQKATFPLIDSIPSSIFKSQFNLMSSTLSPFDYRFRRTADERRNPMTFWDLLYFIYLEYKSFPRFLKFIIFHLYINQEHFYSSFTVARYVRCSSIITSCRRLILSLPLSVTRIEISSGIPFSGQINR